MFDITALVERIVLDEGFSPVPYLCAAGVWTIGYGSTRLRGEPVTQETSSVTAKEALIQLQSDLLCAIADCQSIYSRFAFLLGEHQEVLIGLAYQLGRTRLQGFVKMNSAVERFDYGGWARELKDSKLYTQTPERIDRYITTILSGKRDIRNTE